MCAPLPTAGIVHISAKTRLLQASANPVSNTYFSGVSSEDGPTIPSCYENGRVRYSRLARRQDFTDGIERLKKGALDHRIAIVCAEREPLECHRTILVSPLLDEEGQSIEHIHADGRLESHGEAMDRLLDLVGLPRDDLFRSREELVAEALLRQEVRVAYKEDKVGAGDSGETS